MPFLDLFRTLFLDFQNQIADAYFRQIKHIRRFVQPVQNGNIVQ